MATTLTGATLSGPGAIGGTVVGIKSCTIGGLDVNTINYATAGDTNAVTNNIPGTVTEGPMTLTVVYVKAIMNVLRANAVLRTAGAWTYTDAGASTVAGTAFISSVSLLDSDPDSEDTFQLVLTPSTKWTYTA